MIPEIPDVSWRPKQKVLLFRALRRSMAEVERIMQRFIARELVHLDDHACDRFLAILDHPDADLLDWITGIKPPPVSVDLEDIKSLGRHKREQGHPGAAK